MKRTLVGVLLVMGLAASGQTPDNSKVNRRDQKATAVTPDQQSTNKSDVEVTRQIRKRLTDDDSLSTYVKNIKIITKDGTVTLRGPVRSEDERSRVVKVAEELSGGLKVINELEVSPKK